MKASLLFSYGMVILLTIGFCVSGCRKDDDNDREPANNNLVDIDGNSYKIVMIGGRTWMAENLKVTHYKDGTPIQYIEEDYLWYAAMEGAFCAYGNNMAVSDTFGLLYNWYAVSTGLLAPEGWHVATDDDWNQLETALGMDAMLCYETGFRGTDEGTKMAGSKDLWTDGSLVNDADFDSSKFNALPGGRRYLDGTFAYSHDGGYWWSADEENEYYAYRRHIWFDMQTISRTGANKSIGFSVRCVKNGEI